MELHRCELLLQISAAFIDDTLGFALMRVVSECGQRTGMRDGIDVEGLPRLIEHGNYIGARDTVTNA